MKVSPIRSAIEADTQMLQAFGAVSSTDMIHGMHPRINSLTRYVDIKLRETDDTIEKYEPVLEYVASKYPSTWLKIATLYEEHLPDSEIGKAEVALRRYLEYNPENMTIWNRLILLYRKSGDEQAIVNSLVSMCMATPNAPYEVLSNAAKELNKVFHQVDAPVDTYEKHIVVWQLAELMESRLSDATADDCSLLAWLFLHLRDTDKARHVVDLGLDLEPDNYHCLNIRKRLEMNNAQ